MAGTGPERASVRDAEGRATVRDWIVLTKPTITGLIVAVAVAGYFVAVSGPPSVRALTGLVGFGAAASAGAAALNHYFDRDLDARMRRTRARPIPSGRIAPELGALPLGLGLTAVGIGGAWILLNPLTGASVALGSFTYVVVYTIWLKRRSTWAIVVGGFAGSAPALAGSAAATGSWTLGAIALAGLVFLWTPPHFWSLALMLRNDYRTAGLPMLPRMDDPARSARLIVVSAALLIPATVLLVLAGPLGIGAALALGGLGIAFTAITAPLWRSPDRRWAARGFGFSGIYLLLVIVTLVGAGWWAHPGLSFGF